ncbi:hypothetical protein ACFO3K_02895 [Cellulomonas algicola]|uniref:Asp23/Gls24 family envelope stress response protein n=1 Tax=Cellulomonas algicola TaxID=2071633 RepID=A0A401UY24_9CELL|nr:hypothetical protein [Cellulomonas algicola]GCD19599.1 hypothetical protein CTKZ_11610 [Cellulomonas algicola]
MSDLTTPGRGHPVDEQVRPGGSGRVLTDVPEPGSLAEVVAAVVLAVPGVVRLHGGPFGGLGTYLPGRRVTGVRVDDDGTEVHVVVSATQPVAATAARVQRAVSAVAPMPVRVHVDDLDDPADPADPTEE